VSDRAREWIEPIDPFKFLSLGPGIHPLLFLITPVLGLLFLKVVFLRHNWVGERATGIGVSLPSIDMTLAKFLGSDRTKH